MRVLVKLIFIFLGKGKTYRIAQHSLLKETNFDLPESSQADSLMVFRVFIRTLKKVFLSTRLNSIDSKLGKVAAIIESTNVWDDRVDFILKNGLPKIDLSFEYERIFNEISLKECVQLFLILVFAFPLVLGGSLFSQRRSSYAICLLYACQIHLILKRLERGGVEQLIDFMAYSNQSNWLGILAMERGIEVLKVPSIVPLVGHFKNVIATKLWLSTPYHQDELSILMKDHVVQDYLKGSPKNGLFVEKYKNNWLQPVSKVIGFYSHASWVRVSEDDASSEFGIPEMEEKLLKLIGEYCNTRKEVALHIFTHPREREPTLKDKALKYYKSKSLMSESLMIYCGKEPSSNSFEAAEVGVGTMSSVLFERLLCGYKTLFYVEKMKSFPIMGSEITTICASNRDELFKRLDDQLNSETHPVVQKYRFDADFYQK